MIKLKVCRNACYGGFSLSPKALRRFYELKGIKAYFFKEEKGKFIPLEVDEVKRFSFFYCFSIPNPEKYSNEISLDRYDIERHDPALIQTVEELGEEANGDCAKLVIENIELSYHISDYDGLEGINGGGISYD